MVESGILDTLPAEERKRQEVRGWAGGAALRPPLVWCRGYHSHGDVASPPPTHQPPRPDIRMTTDVLGGVGAGGGCRCSFSDRRPCPAPQLIIGRARAQTQELSPCPHGCPVCPLRACLSRGPSPGLPLAQIVSLWLEHPSQRRPVPNPSVARRLVQTPPQAGPRWARGRAGITLLSPRPSLRS